MTKPGQRRELALVTFLAFTMVLSLIRDAQVLFATPISIGTDGYYYAVQVRALLEFHHLYYPSSTPLAFWILAASAACFGNVVLGIKWMSLLVIASLALLLLGIMKRLLDSATYGLLASCFVLLPAAHLYLLTEFIKNAFALVLFFAALWLWLRANYRLAVAAAILGLITHASIWLILPIVIIACGIWRLCGKRPETVLIAIAAVWTITALLALSPLPRNLAKEVSFVPAFPIQLTNPVGRIESAALLFLGPAAIALALRWRNLQPRSLGPVVLGTTALFAIILHLNPFLNHRERELGIVGRLDHQMFLCLSLIVPITISRVVSREGLRMIFASAFGLLILPMYTEALPYGISKAYLSRRKSLAIGLEHCRSQIPSNSRVVARHGDDYLVTWILRIPAAPVPGSDWHPQDTLWLLRLVDCSAGLGQREHVIPLTSGLECDVLVRGSWLRQPQS